MAGTFTIDASVFVNAFFTHQGGIRSAGPRCGSRQTVWSVRFAFETIRAGLNELER